MEPSTNVSGGEFRLHGEPQANDAGHARARHAGAGHGDPQIVGAGKSFRGDHIRAWRRNVRLETSIARGALAAADVDEAANFVEIGDGDDAITAGKGAHRGAVDIRLVGEKGRKAPQRVGSQWSDLLRVVTFDPGMEAAVAPFLAADTNEPGSRTDADDGRRGQLRAQIDRDRVRAVGGVVELIVNADEAAIGQTAILDKLPGFDLTEPVHSRRTHVDGETVLRTVPKFELVLGHIEHAVADNNPFEFDAQSRLGNLSVRVNLAHEPAEVIGVG